MSNKYICWKWPLGSSACPSLQSGRRSTRSTRTSQAITKLGEMKVLHPPFESLAVTSPAADQQPATCDDATDLGFEHCEYGALLGAGTSQGISTAQGLTSFDDSRSSLQGANLTLAFEYYRSFVFGRRRRLVTKGGFIEDKLGQDDQSGAVTAGVIEQGMDLRNIGWRSHATYGTISAKIALEASERARHAAASGGAVDPADPPGEGAGLAADELRTALRLRSR
eukprot:Skav233572  [mRNA]  locus=scaffold2520:13242:17284:+ [translate_table: standard]